MRAKFVNRVNESVDLISKWLPAKSKAEIDKAMEGKTPEKIFDLGYERNIPYLVTLALNKGVDPSANNNRAIRWASYYGHLEVVKLLLDDKRVDPSADNNYAIRYASESGHVEVVKLLLADKRVDPSVDNNYAIRYASYNGHLEVVKLLLSDKRVGPSADNNEAIRYASWNGHTEVVKLLLAEPRVDPIDKNNKAIRNASRRGHTEVVKLLLADKRVYNSLAKEDKLKYASQVRIMNESTSEELFNKYLPAKSEEDIYKIFKDKNYSKNEILNLSNNKFKNIYKDIVTKYFDEINFNDYNTNYDWLEEFGLKSKLLLKKFPIFFKILDSLDINYDSIINNYNGSIIISIMFEIKHKGNKIYFNISSNNMYDDEIIDISSTESISNNVITLQNKKRIRTVTDVNKYINSIIK